MEAIAIVDGSGTRPSGSEKPGGSGALMALTLAESIVIVSGMPGAKMILVTVCFRGSLINHQSKPRLLRILKC